MSIEITDELIKEFIQNHLDLTDFGYLVVPDDERLNNEALSHIKKAFRDFINKQEPKS